MQRIMALLVSCILISAGSHVMAQSQSNKQQKIVSPKPSVVEPYDDLGDSSVMLHGRGRIDEISDEGLVLDDQMFPFASSYQVKSLDGATLRLISLEPGSVIGYTLNENGQLKIIFPLSGER